VIEALRGREPPDDLPLGPWLPALGRRSRPPAAAVLGREVDWRLLPGITGLPAEAVTVALERLVAALLLGVEGDGFRFRHVPIRDAVLGWLVPPRRTARARAAALAAGARALAGSLGMTLAG